MCTSTRLFVHPMPHLTRHWKWNVNLRQTIEQCKAKPTRTAFPMKEDYS